MPGEWFRREHGRERGGVLAAKRVSLGFGEQEGSLTWGSRLMVPRHN